MNNLATKTTEKASSKWLMLLLLIAIALTVWTAINSDNATEVETIELTDQAATTQGTQQQKSTEKPDSVISQGEVLALNTPDDLSANSRLIPWKKLKRERGNNQSAALFKVHSWLEVPIIKKTKPLPAPPPVAPPAPFTYMGKLEDTPKGTQVFLMANGRLFSVIQGEKIDQQWRLDTEDATTLRLTYLPLNLPQTLSKLAAAVTLEANQPVVEEMNQ